MTNYYSLIYKTIASEPWLLGVITASLLVKIYFLKVLIHSIITNPITQKFRLFLVLAIIGSMFGDMAWFIKLVFELFISPVTNPVVTFFSRIAWALLEVQYLSLSLFIQSLPEKQFRLKKYHYVLISISMIFSLYFFYTAFLELFIALDSHARWAHALRIPIKEIYIIRCVVLYLLNIITIPGLYNAITKICTGKLPKILRKQLIIFLLYLFIPYIIIEFIQAGFICFKSFQANMYPIVSISTLLLTYLLYYCIQRIVKLHFMGPPPVVSSIKPAIIHEFKLVLEKLSEAHTLEELKHITQNFFKNTFDIQAGSIHLITRKIDTESVSHPDTEYLHQTIEHFANKHDALLNAQKIFYYDELAFVHYYQHTPETEKLVSFLDTINADCYIPMFVQHKLIASLIISKNHQSRDCYSLNDKNNMLGFANYLASIINLLHNRYLQTLAVQEKSLKDTLYAHHQEINLYKESIHYFLKESNNKKIGILLYKNKRFTYANKAALELMGIDINKQPGHDLTKKCKQLISCLESDNTTQTATVTNYELGKKIIIECMPSLDQSSAIIAVYYPEISDIIMQHLNELQNPNTWNYLLYLETTQAGHLINQYIPSTTRLFLNYKIDLLKAGFSKGPLLIEAHEEDIMNTVQIIHTMSMRDTLHNIDVSNKPNSSLAEQIFGSGTLHHNNEKPLLEKLDGIGTLFIKNIDLLDQSTQKYLGEYLQYEHYRSLNSDVKKYSNVRIICYSKKNLRLMARDGHFDTNLYNQLKAGTITQPALSIVPQSEIQQIVEGYAQQCTKNELLKFLKDKDIQKILTNCPGSLFELRKKVVHVLTKKTNSTHPNDRGYIGSVYEISNAELLEAARLGKHALKDRQVLHMLWNTFNNQNKIAQFLGVNRSSINRRLKEFNIIVES